MNDEAGADDRVPHGGPMGRRMRRADRREQLLDAATRAFARTGFAATGLDEIAAEAGVTRVLLYRHFDSKAGMYAAVLDRACQRLESGVGSDDFDEQTIPALLHAAAADPDAFRLLFRHAVREPEFRGRMERLTATSADIAQRNLAARIPDGPWLHWASRLIPALTIEAVIAWLDAGTPDPDRAPGRINHAIHAVIHAACAVEPATEAPTPSP